MEEYLWTGKNTRGKKQKGTIKAQSMGAARIALRKQGIFVVRIKKKSRHFQFLRSLLRNSSHQKEVIIFSRQMATMLNAGLPLLQSLKFLESQHFSSGFQSILSSVSASVESGVSFSNSLKNHPNAFNQLYIHMVTAGEAAGILGDILERLAAHMEKMAALKKRIKNAMLYPMFTMIVAFSVLMLLLIFVIPVFEEMFADMGAALPSSTMMVISMSDVAAKHIWHILGGIAVLLLLAKWGYHTKKGRKIADYILLNLPFTGNMITKMSMAQFTRTASSLLSSGVPIMDTLHISAGTSGNILIQEAISDLASGLSQGRFLAEMIKENRIFPAMVSSMIAAGEVTGSLDKMMENIANFYDGQVDEALNTLAEMIEPVMLVFLGIVIGTLVVSMYVPIFTMTGTLI